MTATGPTTQEYRPPEGDPIAPPTAGGSPAEWARANLFNTWYNAIITLVLAPAVAWVLLRALRFVFVSARWEIVQVNLTNFMIGTYPRGELWRPWAAMVVLAVTLGVWLGAASRAAAEQRLAREDTSTSSRLDRVRRAGPLLLLLAALVAFVRTPTPLLLLGVVIVLLAATYHVGTRIAPAHRRFVHLGGVVGLVAAYGVVVWFDGVPVASWGGLMLTVFFTVGGIALAFPFGVLLALGRRSSLPAVRLVCVVYIEVMRGLPLIALLFVGWLVLGFFLPPAFPTPDRAWRALIIFILFTAAYVAEIVRGGLQSVPQGQVEAAQAVGLRPWKVLRLVVLPQALRNVIPAMVGQFISLFKDTSLVLIIGLTELLRVARLVTQQPGFLGQGLHAETLLFVSFIYWVGCYWMSRESQRLERKLGVGER